MRRRSLLIALVIGTLKVGLAGAQPLVVRIPSEPRSLDWNISHTYIEQFVLELLVDGLVKHDANLDVMPALAEKWAVSKDGLVYTFHLRQGVRWSDGMPVRASHFVDSWKRILQPKTAAYFAYQLYDVEGAEDFSKGKISDFSQVGIKAVDDSTFQVKLRARVNYWIHIPAMYVFSPIRLDIIDKFGSGWASPGRIVTNGAYKIESHDLESKYVLKRNALYYGKPNQFPEIDLLIVKDDATANLLFKSGKLDFLPNLNTLFTIREWKGKQELRHFPLLKTWYLTFSSKKYPASDIGLRRAVARSIDKNNFKKLLDSNTVSATTFVPPGLLGYQFNAGLTFDLAQARQSLADSGIDPIKQAIELELMCVDSERAKLVAEFIQQELKRNLGIKVSIRPYENKVFRNFVDLKEFQLLMMSWVADFPDPDNFMSRFHSSSRRGYQSDSYDKEIVDARSSSNLERAAHYKKAHEILLEKDAVAIPLFYEQSFALANKNAEKVRLSRAGTLDLSAHVPGVKRPKKALVNKSKHH